MKPSDLLTPTPAGLYCPPADIYIDPLRPVGRALITHGHSDHARAGHGAVLATQETLAIMALRYGEAFAGTRQVAAPGEVVRIGAVAFRFVPAGHVLGSAQIVVERLTLIAVGDQPKTLPVFTDRPPLMIGPVAIGYQLIWIVGGSLAIVAALAAFFGLTRTGKAMRACSINREAAALQGIPVSRMLALAFALSAALGAIAGILITPTQYTAFNVGVPFAISGFIAAIVGGFGRPFGAFLGGLLLGLLQALAIVGFGAGLKNVAALSVLLLFLFIRPSGILGAAK